MFINSSAKCLLLTVIGACLVPNHNLRAAADMGEGGYWQAPQSPPSRWDFSEAEVAICDLGDGGKLLLIQDEKTFVRIKFDTKDPVSLELFRIYRLMFLSNDTLPGRGEAVCILPSTMSAVFPDFLSDGKRVPLFIKCISRAFVENANNYAAGKDAISYSLMQSVIAMGEHLINPALEKGFITRNDEYEIYNNIVEGMPPVVKALSQKINSANCYYELVLLGVIYQLYHRKLTSFSWTIRDLPLPKSVTKHNKSSLQKKYQTYKDMLDRVVSITNFFLCASEKYFKTESKKPQTAEYREKLKLEKQETSGIYVAGIDHILVVMDRFVAIFPRDEGLKSSIRFFKDKKSEFCKTCQLPDWDLVDRKDNGSRIQKLKKKQNIDLQENMQDGRFISKIKADFQRFLTSISKLKPEEQKESVKSFFINMKEDIIKEQNINNAIDYFSTQLPLLGGNGQHIVGVISGIHFEEELLRRFVKAILRGAKNYTYNISDAGFTDELPLDEGKCRARQKVKGIYQYYRTKYLEYCANDPFIEEEEKNEARQQLEDIHLEIKQQKLEKIAAWLEKIRSTSEEKRKAKNAKKREARNKTSPEDRAAAQKAERNAHAEMRLAIASQEAEKIAEREAGKKDRHELAKANRRAAKQALPILREEVQPPDREPQAAVPALKYITIEAGDAKGEFATYAKAIMDAVDYDVEGKVISANIDNLKYRDGAHSLSHAMRNILADILAGNVGGITQHHLKILEKYAEKVNGVFRRGKGSHNMLVLPPFEQGLMVHIDGYEEVKFPPLEEFNKPVNLTHGCDGSHQLANLDDLAHAILAFEQRLLLVLMKADSEDRPQIGQEGT